MRTMMLLGSLLCPLLVSAADPDWTRWRGPLSTGWNPEADPPLQWDARTNIRWKTRIPGKGSSTPVILGKKIFVLSAEDTGKPANPGDIPQPAEGFNKRTQAPKTYHRFVVVCLDRETGKILWEKTATEAVPHEGHHPSHSYGGYSAVVDARRVYAWLGTQGVFCYDHDGKLLWNKTLGRMETRLGWGEAGSPALHGGTLVINWDHEGKDFIVALDATSGKERWKVDRDEPTSWATPLIVEHQGTTQVIVSGTNRIRSYALATGKVLWECGGQTINAIPSPVASGGIVYCMSGYRGSFATAIPLASQGDLTDSSKLLWQHKRGTPYVPSPLLVEDRLYFTSTNEPILTVLDTKTGKPLLDRVRLPGLGQFYASPAGAKGKVYLVDRDGTTLVVKRSDKLEVLATNRLDEPVDASPVLLGRQLFLRGHQHLFCIEESR